jgi:filamentous hemagglutinin family protein
MVAAAVSYGVALAQIITDGSLGVGKSLSGSPFLIEAELGKLSGNNLFHSFSTFNLTQGQNATFKGPSTLANIVARVTGGSSSIDGEIATATGGSPNLFLINPAGVVFGANATLDVEGSFHVSTADYLKFADGVKFMSNLGNGSSFSTAAPAAFGFLDPKIPEPISIDGSILNVRIGSTLNIVGGDVEIVGGKLTAPGGTIAATSAASGGEVPLDPVSGGTTVGSFGIASITSSALLDASDYSGSSPTGGSVYVRAGTLTVDGSTIAADNNGTGPGGAIALAAEQEIIIANSGVVSTPNAEGSAPAILLTGGDVTINHSGVGSYSLAYGDAADVTIKADSLAITHSGISSVAGFEGDAGDITVDVAGALEIHAGAITTYTSWEINGGDSGQITVNAGSITLAEGSRIVSETYASGATGTVSVDAAGALVIMGDSSIATSGTAFFTTGAGQIAINADSITLADGGRIDSDGTGGIVIVEAAGALVIAGDSSRISASSFQGSDAGQVTVSASSITLVDGGRIESTTSGAGNGGNIVVHATQALEIHGTLFDGTGIFAVSGAGATGDAGKITLDADSITIDGTGQVTTGTLGSGKGGDITVNATGALTITGAGYATSGISASSHSGVFLPDPTVAGDGGQITIAAESIALADGGVIESVSEGAGNSGDIAVEVAGALTIDGLSAISASSYIAIAAPGGPVGLAITGDSNFFLGGNAGQVKVSADSVTLTDGGVIESVTFGDGNGGNVAVHAAGALTITGDPNSDSFTGIAASSSGDFGLAGDAGQVTVSADSIALASGGRIESTTAGAGNGGNVFVQATQGLEIRGDTRTSNLTGIFADSYAVYEPFAPGGDAGTITVNAGSITIDATGAISGATFGSGNGGDVTVNVDGALAITGDPDSPRLTGISAATQAGENGGEAGQVTVNADSIMLANSGQIASSTFGSGDGGDVSVHATGALVIHGNPDSPIGTGIAADSLEGATGDAGTVTVHAGSATIEATGQISTNTHGPGTGGDITVDVAGALAITGDPESDFDTGIGANSQPGATGDAGKIIVNAGSVTIDAAGAIKTNTYGSGKGGDVTLNVAGMLAITGDPDSGLLTGIAADSRHGATGDAGKVAVTAGSVTIDDTGQISSNTFSTGTGGDVTVNAAGAIAITGDPESEFFTGISAGAESVGDAGQVTVGAGSISIADNAQIASSTSGAGNGGNVTVDVTGALQIHGDPDSFGPTGIAADSLPGATGNAGQITVHADSLTLTNAAQIATNSSGPGIAGDILIKAQNVVVDNSIVSSDSSGTGSSGSVVIDPTSILIKNGSTISAKATGGGVSGDVVLVADMITIANSVVSTESESGGGGNIQITAFGLLDIIQSVVSATVQNGDLNAGNVTIYADLLVLDQSVLSANAFEGRGGNLLVTARGLIATPDSVISASSERGVNGLVDVNALSNDVTSGLAELSDALVQDASRLACTSAPSGPQDPFSSVIVHGRGEYDFDPDAPGPATYSSALAPQVQPAPARNAAAIQRSCDR